MAISFACPHCGKKFEISESAVGKKARCKRCETVFVIPNTAVSRPPDIKINAYCLGDEDEEPSPGHKAGASPLIKEGTRIDLIVVEESSPDRLTLVVKTTWLLLWMIGGIIALVVGMFLITLVERRIENADGPVRISRLVVMIPFALISVGVSGICWSARLGTRLTFDGHTSRLSVRRLLVWETLWEAEDLDHIVFVTLKPEALTDRARTILQACEAYVVDRRGRAVAMIERVGRNRPKDSLPLAMACLQAGNLLGLPVVVDKREEPVIPELRRAVELLRGAKARPGLRRVSTFRRPLLTVYNVGSVLAGVVVLLGFGRFMLKWTGLGPNINGAVAAVASADLPADGGLPNAPRGGQQARLQQKPTEIDRILGEVGSPDENKRQFALSQLENRDPGNQRDAVLQAATRLLTAVSPNDRERAVRVLGRWGTDDDLARVLALIDDPEQVVRNSVAQAVTRRKYVASATALARRLHNPQDRFTMAVRLCELGPGAAPVVVKLLDDPDDEVKIEAVKILEDIGTTAELEALSAACRRYQAVTAQQPGRTNPSGIEPTAEELHFASRIVRILESAMNSARTRSPVP